MSHFAPPKVVPPFRFATVEVGVVVNQCICGVDKRTNGLANTIICVLTFWHQYLHVVLYVRFSRNTQKYGCSQTWYE